MADRRYQVFISSTFRDLIEERQAVLKAVLEMDHMPAGMELFPASDESAWALIKDVIDASDYYVLIIGGRYGSLHKQGLGYTEMEYDYAVSQRKAVVPLLHQDPDNLPRGNTETDPEAWAKLVQFRTRVQDAHTCTYWTSIGELKANVIIGLTAMTKKRPAVGWVRANEIPTGARLEEVLALRDRVADLERQLDFARTDAPPGTEELRQGEDPIQLPFQFTAVDADGDSERHEGILDASWNELFSHVAPTLLSEATDGTFRTSLKRLLLRQALDQLHDDPVMSKKTASEFHFEDKHLDTCVVQLRALGLITESQRKRSVTDRLKYWALTPYGDRIMVQLRALRRRPLVRRTRGTRAPLAIGGEVEVRSP